MEQIDIPPTPLVYVYDDFASLLPQCSEREDIALKESIKRFGCIEKLVVWERYGAHDNELVEQSLRTGSTIYCKYCRSDSTVSYGDGIAVCDNCGYGLAALETRRILLDGHRRWKICQELGITPRLATVHCRSVNHAAVWILNNALMQRNLSAGQLAKLQELHGDE